MNLGDYDKKYKTNLVQAVFDLLNDWNAPEGEQRLKLIAEHFSKLSPEQAYHLLNPEAYRREVEEIQVYRRWSKVFQLGRIVLGLAPLIVTWGSLSWAVLAYGNYVSMHRQVQGQMLSFLQLWQQGSLTGLTFFGTGVIDVALLILFLSFSIYSLMLEYHARSESEKFALELQSVTNELMVAVAKEGRSDVASNTEIERIVRYIKEAIAESYQDLGVIVDKAKDTIVKTGETAKDMFDNQIKPMLTGFDSNVKSFHTDLNTLNDKVKELVAANTLLASTAGDMANSAGSMAASATKMANNASDLAINVLEQKEISKDMDTHLIELNKTEKEVAKDIRGAAGEMKQSAENLQKAAEKVELIGKAITPQLVQRTADNAKIFADKAGEVATELQRVVKALQGRASKPRWWPF